MDAETARYLLQLDDDIQALWRTLESHTTADEYRQIAEEHRENARRIRQQTEQYRTELATHVKSLHEEAARYINIVSVIGYAGYFATWGFTKDVLGREAAAFVGLAGMVSVGVFVLWEMLMVMHKLKSVAAVAHVFQSGTSVQDFEELSGELKRKEARTVAIYGAAHPLVFGVSFLAAIAGGLTMMHKLYASL